LIGRHFAASYILKQFTFWQCQTDIKRRNILAHARIAGAYRSEFDMITTFDFESEMSLLA